MSDPIKHECGIALIRLKQPLAYYREKYDDVLWGFQKLFLLMEKQHNRGQDGAGIGACKLQMPQGQAFMFRERDNGRNPISTVIKKQMKLYNELLRRGVAFPEFPTTVKEHFPFAAEVLMGHLRYGTSGGYAKSVCQPYFRRSPWPTRNLMLAGNFNITNVEQLNEKLINRGAHPIFDTDTQTVLEEIGYHLDEEHQQLYHQLRDSGTPTREISGIIAQRLDLGKVLRDAAASWDGGYTLAGMIGTGDAFILRDPCGIRPASYFEDDEVVACASERVALMTIFDKSADDIQEVPPGHAVIIKQDAHAHIEQVKEPQKPAFCTFERIYFSRGNDPDIYRERKALGAALAQTIVKEIGRDFSKSVFSFIPNTAETAYYGLMAELNRLHRADVKGQILAAHKEGSLDSALLDHLLDEGWPRGEKVALKDIKLRTFISQERNRVQLASHVYDVSYGVVKPGDNLVCVDDSIVRGTTLRQSILRILARTEPAKIIIASTAPQIRYPDCYGIDMSEMGKFVAFQATIELLKERGQAELIGDVYRDCLAQEQSPSKEPVNHVKRLYAPFSPQEISAKIAQLVFPKKDDWEGELIVVYQTIGHLHAALPHHKGDWYFTGDYPTPGGYAVVNRSFIRYFEGVNGRGY